MNLDFINKDFTAYGVKVSHGEFNHPLVLTAVNSLLYSNNIMGVLAQAGEELKVVVFNDPGPQFEVSTWETQDGTGPILILNLFYLTRIMIEDEVELSNYIARALAAQIARLQQYTDGSFSVVDQQTVMYKEQEYPAVTPHQRDTPALCT